MGEDLDSRRRRAVWRAAHRGMRELDLVLGNFARVEAPAMEDEELSAFEALLDAPDSDLYEWILGLSPAPQPYEGPLLSALKAFRPGPPDLKAC